MKNALLMILAMMTLVGCAVQERRVEEGLSQPIYCGTAEGDIRVLEAEKANLARQIAAGATTILPAGIVVGIVTGTTGTRFRVATGEYNRKIEDRIAEIKRTCGV
jgi:hypothetical protein